MLEKNYDTITIQDITERAGLRRATFYLHYHDKEELLLTILKAAVDDLTTHLQAESSTAECLTYEQVYQSDLKMYRHVAERASLYRIILGRQETNQIIQQVRAYIAAQLIEMLRQDSKTNRFTIPIEVIANYMAGVKITMISWWLEQDMPCSVEEMAAMCAELTLHGALTALPTPIAFA